jgi:hypothetical protein
MRSNRTASNRKAFDDQPIKTASPDESLELQHDSTHEDLTRCPVYVTAHTGKSSFSGLSADLPANARRCCVGAGSKPPDLRSNEEAGSATDASPIGDVFSTESPLIIRANASSGVGDSVQSRSVLVVGQSAAVDGLAASRGSHPLGRTPRGRVPW